MKKRVWGSILGILGVAAVTFGFLSVWDSLRANHFSPSLSAVGIVKWVNTHDLRGEILFLTVGILLLLTGVVLFLTPTLRLVPITADKAQTEGPVASDSQDPISVPQVSEPRVICYLRTRLVGATFQNVDGTSRQSALAGTSEGDVLICRTRTYRHAPDTVAIYTVEGKRVGQLDAAFTRMLREQYPNHRIGVCVETLEGGDGLPYTCSLRVAVYRN